MLGLEVGDGEWALLFDGARDPLLSLLGPSLQCTDSCWAPAMEVSGEVQGVGPLLWERAACWGEEVCLGENTRAGLSPGHRAQWLSAQARP